MFFLLFLLLGVSLANIVVTLFFPYPMALMALGLQLSFFVLSFIIFVRRLGRRRKMIRSFLMMLMHGSALFLVVYLFFHVSLPNRESADSDAFRSGMKGLYKHFNTPDTIENQPNQDPPPTDKLKISTPDFVKSISSMKNSI